MVKRVDGKGEIRWKDRPVTFEELDDEVTMSGIEDAFAIPDEDYDKMIRDAGLGDILDKAQGNEGGTGS